MQHSMNWKRQREPDISASERSDAVDCGVEGRLVGSMMLLVAVIASKLRLYQITKSPAVIE